MLLSPAEAGDEPCLLASVLPGLMVVMGSDRYRAGCMALDKLSPEYFILDDGFQHQRLARDLDILLLDGAAPFANGWTLPAGFLREPLSASRRSDLVIMTRCTGVERSADFLPGNIPVCSSSHSLKGYIPLAGGELRQLSDLVGRRIVAFCGIADPMQFFDGIEAAGVRLAATLAFPDHTAYGTAELEALGRLKQQTSADCLMTTAKDAVKLHPYLGIIGDCFVVQLELTLHDTTPFMAALNKVII
jgi:tetraacyldisaccharide 4'-kinase